MVEDAGDWLKNVGNVPVVFAKIVNRDALFAGPGVQLAALTNVVRTRALDFEHVDPVNTGFRFRLRGNFVLLGIFGIGGIFGVLDIFGRCKGDRNRVFGRRSLGIVRWSWARDTLVRGHGYLALSVHGV